MRVALILLLAFQCTNAFGAYEQKIYFVGMSCSSIQKDSVAYPANEIFINTIIYQPATGRSYHHKHPHTQNVYSNVNKGFVATGPAKLIWRGKKQPLVLGVAMWEHDDGGTKVDVFSSLLTEGIKQGLSARGGKTPQRQPAMGLKNDPVTKFFSENLRTILGTGNDLVGYSRLIIQKGDYTQKQRKRFKGMEYHLATSHRQGGANCKSYFLFKRGKHYREAKKDQQRKKQQPQKQHHQQQQDLFAAGQSRCRSDFDNCANHIQLCKENIQRHDNRATQCAKHGWSQYEKCVNYYQSNARTKRTSPQQAKKICRSKYDDYVRGCPQNKRDTCGSYTQCDTRYKNCMNALASQQKQFIPPRQQPYLTNDYRRDNQPGKSKKYPKKKSQRVILNLVNRCQHLNSIALNYKNKNDKWVTEGWHIAYLDRASNATIMTSGTTIYVHSNWGKVVDSKKRKNYKQLEVAHQSFKYSGSSKLKSAKKRLVKFYPMYLQKGKSKSDLVLSCK